MLRLLVLLVLVLLVLLVVREASMRLRLMAAAVVTLVVMTAAAALSKVAAAVRSRRSAEATRDAQVASLGWSARRFQGQLELRSLVGKTSCRRGRSHLAPAPHRLGSWEHHHQHHQENLDLDHRGLVHRPRSLRQPLQHQHQHQQRFGLQQHRQQQPPRRWLPVSVASSRTSARRRRLVGHRPWPSCPGGAGPRRAHRRSAPT